MGYVPARYRVQGIKPIGYSHESNWQDWVLTYSGLVRLFKNQPLKINYFVGQLKDKSGKLLWSYPDKNVSCIQYYPDKCVKLHQL